MLCPFQWQKREVKTWKKNDGVEEEEKIEECIFMECNSNCAYWKINRCIKCDIEVRKETKEVM